jgi:hypothetical protein
MSHVVFQNGFFKPPLAIARIGGSNTPLDAFVWDSDKSIHGANRTVIRPTVTLKVLPDGESLAKFGTETEKQGNKSIGIPFFSRWDSQPASAGHPKP